MERVMNGMGLEEIFSQKISKIKQRIVTVAITDVPSKDLIIF